MLVNSKNEKEYKLYTSGIGFCARHTLYVYV